MRLTGLRRTSICALLLAGATTWAEPAWLSARARVPKATQVSGLLGTRTVGIGLLHPDGVERKAGTSGELLYSFVDRTVDARGTRLWRLTSMGLFTASFALGGALIVVPEGLDLGLGPHSTLNVSIGGDIVSVDLNLHAGAELFAQRVELRFPLRAGLGLTVNVGRLSVAARARLGADIQPARAFAGRGELMLVVGF
jgi:hypothetical protein